MLTRRAICFTCVSALATFGAFAVGNGQVLADEQEALVLPEVQEALSLSELNGVLNPSENFPYFWAWWLFTEVNSPSDIEKLFSNKKKVVWENWATDSETFPTCPDASNPPTWPGTSFRLKNLGQRLQTVDNGSANSLNWYTLDSSGTPTSVEVTDPQEVRRNQASFDYIVNNDLYYTEGLADAFANAETAVADAGGDTAQSMAAVLDTIDFPTNAIEIKADWVPLRNIPFSERADYYINWGIVSGGGIRSLRRYALVAMHIMSKDLPDWFWATWVNKNVLGRCDYYGCRDDFGIKPNYTAPNDEINYPYDEGVVTLKLKALMDSKGVDEVFQNYRLVGTQTDFTDATGNPTLMSNTITEQDQLQTGSCITCHARAAVDSTGATLSVISDTAQEREPPTGDAFVTDNGTPDPDWFWDLDYGDSDFFTSNTTVTGVDAVQIDFVWGVLNANSVDNCSTED